MPPTTSTFTLEKCNLAFDTALLFLWVLQLFFMVLFEVAKVIGWIILFIGLILQLYAEYSPQQHISPPKADMLSRNTKLDACIILASVLSTFLSTLSKSLLPHSDAVVP